MGLIQLDEGEVGAGRMLSFISYMLPNMLCGSQWFIPENVYASNTCYYNNMVLLSTKYIFKWVETEKKIVSGEIKCKSFRKTSGSKQTKP